MIICTKLSSDCALNTIIPQYWKKYVLDKKKYFVHGFASHDWFWYKKGPFKYWTYMIGILNIQRIALNH